MPPSIRFYKKRPRWEIKVPHVIYDMSIEDVEERKEKALRFETMFKTAEYIGMKHYQYLAYYTDTQAIKKKKRFWSEKHQRYFAIRRCPVK